MNKVEQLEGNSQVKHEDLELQDSTVVQPVKKSAIQDCCSIVYALKDGISMTGTDDGHLEKLDPAQKSRKILRNVILAFKIIVFIGVVVGVIILTLGKVGSPKGKQTQFDQVDVLKFNATDAPNIMNLQVFSNYSYESVKKMDDAIECAEEQDQEVCQLNRIHICESQYREKLFAKSELYFDCMKGAISDPLTFCKFAFGNYSRMFSGDDVGLWATGDEHSVNKYALVGKAEECFGSEHQKEFCDQTNLDAKSKKTCYKKYDLPTDELDKEIECSEKEDADERYECFGWTKDSIHFCADKFRQSSEIDTCLESKGLTKSGDALIKDEMLAPFKFWNYPDNKRVSSTFGQFLRSQSYREFLYQLNKLQQEKDPKNTLVKQYPSLECEIMLKDYDFENLQNYPNEDKYKIQGLITQAQICFISKGMFNHVHMCYLEYVFDRYAQQEEKQEDLESSYPFIEKCFNQKVKGSSYEKPFENLDRIYPKLMNPALEKYEETLQAEQGEEYRSINLAHEYCNRRFKGEEAMSCLMYSTDEFFDEMGPPIIDGCSKRIFSQDEESFLYTRVYKYTCIKSVFGQGKLYKWRESFQQGVDECLEKGHPLSQELCLRKYEEQYQFKTMFQSQMLPFMEHYEDELHLAPVGLHDHHHRKEQYIREYLCKNTVPKLVVKPKIQTVFKLGHEYEETLTALTKMTQGYYRFKENNEVEIIRNDVDALFVTKWLKTTSKYKHDNYARKVTFDFNFDQYSSKAEFFFDEKYEKIVTGTLTSLYFDDETQTPEIMKFGPFRKLNILVTKPYVQESVVPMDCQVFTQREGSQRFAIMVNQFSEKELSKIYNYKNEQLDLLVDQNLTQVEIDFDNTMQTQLFNLSMYQYKKEGLLKQFKDISEVQKHLYDQQFDRLFHTDEIPVGIKDKTQYFDTVKAVPESHITVEEVTIMGVPTAFKRYTKNRFSLGFTREKSYEVRTLKDDDQQRFKLVIPFEIDFVVYKVIQDKFSFLDCLASLGGIGACIQMGISAFGPVFFAIFMVSFVNQVMRKRNQGSNIKILKEIVKKHSEIEQKIKDKIDYATAEKKEFYKIQLELIGPDKMIYAQQAIGFYKDYKFKYLYSLDPQKPISAGLVTHEETSKLADEWQKILQEHDKAYPIPPQPDFAQIVKLITTRLSLYAIYELFDQTQDNRALVKDLQKQLKDQQKEIGDMKKMIEDFKKSN